MALLPTLYHVPKTISSPIYQTLLELGPIATEANGNVTTLSFDGDRGDVCIETLKYDDLKKKDHTDRNPMGTAPTLVVKKKDQTDRNPMGTAPTLVDEDEDLTIWESGVILAYLLEKYDTKHDLHPRPDDTAAERYKYLHIQQFLLTTVYPFMASWYQRSLRTEQDDPNNLRYYAWHLKIGDTLENFIGEGPYFMGSRMTAVDLLAVKPLLNARSLKNLKEFPKLENLLTTLQELASFATAYGVDDDKSSDCRRRRSMILAPPLDATELPWYEDVQKIIFEKKSSSKKGRIEPRDSSNSSLTDTEYDLPGIGIEVVPDDPQFQKPNDDGSSDGSDDDPRIMR